MRGNQSWGDRPETVPESRRLRWASGLGLGIWAVVVFQAGVLGIASAGPGSLSELQVLTGIVLIALSLMYGLTAVIVGAHVHHLGPVALGALLAACAVPISAGIKVPFLWAVPSTVVCLLVLLFIAERRLPGAPQTSRH